MRIQDLVQHWENASRGERTQREFAIHLPLKEASQILALKEMYPDCTEEQLLTDLLCFALQQLRESFPYERGDKQIAQDEYGDPIYEDAGQTPRFIQLTQKYRQTLEVEHHRGEPN